ncbi:hypothetical protein METBIDRAFT_37307 [Metschnikowia bicuspidata var. bicuspidata NRRL YB-4993]|uniref:Uncharacterized protein n=1 Tax=Metschnikowia bicuspidata var. bicuspidata NRRL YB-4993 TaxID=869754 RepID=A0A1A0HGX4_9ASCO|nr:hypothetical protein METBIDRAFT_37307 [Metschnikowia bicuspidata var. bicuspidata NRRL YB-4993]OBA23132.1 hypothetical protein METBIDRAFT_37307 [Metschnikowia bicuspidata var. bicuspidata NRRL YB-4993]
MSLQDKKNEQLSQLSEQAAVLHSNLSSLDSLVKDACYQHELMQLLGMMHGALFMASHQVFGNQMIGDTHTESASEDEN